ncbi:hypothetical protein M405DRAFT_840404 [Rhizopogon salebrosus TDB-379]|nr:hypothetical protein M405DRAFT_840404 [Rhizopogon salebrosus TDB-379]
MSSFLSSHVQPLSVTLGHLINRSSTPELCSSSSTKICSLYTAWVHLLLDIQNQYIDAQDHVVPFMPSPSPISLLRMPSPAPRNVSIDKWNIFDQGVTLWVL